MAATANHNPSDSAFSTSSGFANSKQMPANGPFQLRTSVETMLTKLKYSVVCFVALLSAIAFSNPAMAQDSIDFVKDIQPIFEAHCVRCHGEVDPESMRMDIADEVMDYVEAEDAENSQLYEVISTDDEDTLMPPVDEGERLTEEQVQKVAQWINEGANWPDGLQLQDRYVDPAENEGNASTSDEQTPDGQAAKPKKGDAPVAVPSDLPARPVKKKKQDTVYRAIGSMHPAVIHLPIGLLMAAGLFGLLGIRGNFVMSDCAYYCLWLGTIGCIAACVTGWWSSPMAKMGTVEQFSDIWDSGHRVFWHRTSGMIVTIVALLLALYATGARNRDPDDGALWKLGLVVLAVGIAWVGHKGGELTHGKHHYDDVKELLNSVFPMGEEVEPDPPEKKVEDPAMDADATGTVKEPEVPGIDLNNDGKSDIGMGRDT